MQASFQPQRGRIIAYQTNGQGTVSIGGRMQPFDATLHWRSPVAPALNALVQAEFDATGALTGLTLVPAQQEVQEAAQQAAARAGELARERGGQAWRNARAVLGDKVLILLALLIVGAFFLDAFSVRSFASVSRSYWALLGLTADNMVAGGEGGFTLARFAFLAALAGCGATLFSTAPKAALGKCAPLLVVLVHGAVLTMKIRGVVSTAGEAASGMGGLGMARFGEQMAREMLNQVWQGLSIGVGLYLTLASALVLAVFGWFEYRARLRA